MSKGLNAPKEYTNEKDISEVLDNLENVKRVYTSEFESEYYGHVTYTQIICNEVLPCPTPLRRFFHGLRVTLTPLPDNTPTPF